MRIWMWLVLLVLVGCQPVRPAPEIQLDKRAATRGESVRVDLRGLEAAGAKVFLGDSQITPSVVSPQTLTLVVPGTAPAGEQEVRVESGGRSATARLRVLGNVVADELLITLRPGSNRAEIIRRLEALGFRFVQQPEPLGGREADNPCSGELGIIRVGDKPLGQALAELEQLGLGFQADPYSVGSLDAVDYLGAVGAGAAQQRLRTGRGITIAILDTGVGHPELANLMGLQFAGNSRILPGYNFVANNTNVTDDFDISDPTEAGGRERYHGTIAAVMAAGGSTSPRVPGGVAPGATILPVKVCDSVGRCLASHAVKGVCWALNQVPDRSKLVLNLSFGGDTPVDVLEAILAYAIRQNVQVAAAGGNQGEGAPKHYPAAYGLPGLVAVAALTQTSSGWAPAPFSSRGPNQTYLDLAAPGANITFPFPLFSYNGTSFATPLVAGAMALWREANPGLTPAQIEQKLKETATPLPFPTNQVGAGLLNLSSQP